MEDGEEWHENMEGRVAREIKIQERSGQGKERKKGEWEKGGNGKGTETEKRSMDLCGIVGQEAKGKREGGCRKGDRE